MNSISQDLNADDFKPLRLLHHSQIPSGQPLKILLHPPLETRIAAPTKQPTVLGVTWPLFFPQQAHSKVLLQPAAAGGRDDGAVSVYPLLLTI